jgi:uncharacterized protein (DUF302 family)
MTEFGMKWKPKGTYEETLARVPELLKAEGFGVLTRIDMKATMKEKLGVDFRRYQILGACNPNYAHKVLGVDLGAGVMLPCNVLVWEADDGGAVVTAVDPAQTVAAQDPRFVPLIAEVREKLVRALSGLAG